MRVQLLFRLLTEKKKVLNKGQQRNQRIAIGVLSSSVQRVTGFMVSIISVPLAVSYLGHEQYGLWIAVTSLVGWLGLSDIGMSYSLSLLLSHTFARNDRKEAQRAVSSAFFGLCLVSLILCIAFIVLEPFISWDKLFKVHDQKVHSEIFSIIIISFVIFVINLPLTIVGKILNSYQEFVLANMIVASTNLLTLAALIFACWVKASLIVLVALYSGVNIIVSILTAVWMFCIHKSWLRPQLSCFNITYTKRLMVRGIMYFVASVSAIINFNTDTIVISSFLNVTEVTPFSIAAKLCSYGIIISTLISGSIQPAYTEALARKEYNWIKKTFIRHMTATMCISTLIFPVLYLIANPIITYWTHGAVHPTVSTLAWMALWGWLQAICIPMATYLNGIGKPKGMMLYGWGAALLNLFLSIVLIRYYGVAGVVAASCIAFILINVPCALIETKWRMNKTEDMSDYCV